MKFRHLAAAASLAAAALTAHAADSVKIGFVSTLSGPNASVGLDIRDGFNLGLKLLGGKLGGLKADVILLDDQLNPDTAKQHVDRLLKRDRVDFVTGVVFSNIVLAVAPQVTDAKTFFIGPNAGPRSTPARSAIRSSSRRPGRARPTARRPDST